MDKAKSTIGNILTEFAMIDSMLRSVYEQHRGVDPVHPSVNDGDLDKCFFDFLDYHPDLGLDTKNKKYKDRDGAGIHLKTLVEKLRETRNIAAHQTWSLVTGLSNFPIGAHGQSADSYVGSVDDLTEQWRFYSYQFLPIFEQWNYGGFDEQDMGYVSLWR